MSRTLLVGFDGEGDQVVVAHAAAVASSLLEHPYYYEPALRRAQAHGARILEIVPSAKSVSG